MRIAILGCAHMHVYSYTEALKKLGAEIVGAFDKDKSRAEKYGAQCEVKIYETAEALLEQTSEAVIICAENVYHKEYTLLAAKKNKHIIVEKPIATSYDDAQDMIQCCKENNVKLMVCYPCRYATPVKEAKAYIEAGNIGEPICITATNHGSLPSGWFVDKNLAGGGAAIDHIVHVVDLLKWYFNAEVKSVYSAMDTLIHNIDVEDCGHVLIEFENGMIASIDHSWNRPKSFPCWGDVVLDITGTKESIHVDAFAEHGNVYSDSKVKMTHFSFGNDMDFEMIKDFVNCIENDLPSPITGEDGLYSLNVALMAYSYCKK